MTFNSVVHRALTLTEVHFCLQKILGLSLSPISLIAPRQIMSWLNQYHDHCEEIVGYVKYVVTQHLTTQNKPSLFSIVIVLVIMCSAMFR